MDSKDLGIARPLYAPPQPDCSHFLPGKNYPRLSDETRELVPTDCAAFHLNRRPQTLREWACLENGLLRPVRVGKRLGWRTADLRRILQGGRDEA
jgi:hypothetical protein